MQTRTLGKNGLEVSALGLGCMGMSFGYGLHRSSGRCGQGVDDIRKSETFLKSDVKYRFVIDMATLGNN